MSKAKTNFWAVVIVALIIAPFVLQDLLFS